MKRFLTLALAALTLLGLSSCNKEAKLSRDAAGWWQATSVSSIVSAGAATQKENVDMEDEAWILAKSTDSEVTLYFWDGEDGFEMGVELPIHKDGIYDSISTTVDKIDADVTMTFAPSGSKANLSIQVTGLFEGQRVSTETTVKLSKKNSSPAGYVAGDEDKATVVNLARALNYLF